MRAALELLRARSTRLRLVIYDCDGVLVDSEPVANRVCAQEISRLGWPITAEECTVRFLGMSLPDMCPIIETQLGRPLPAGWMPHLADCLTRALSHEAALMEGAEATLRATSALGLDWRIASNSGHEELHAKFACTGLTALVAGRVHSASEVRSGKPSPDLFLAAAAASAIAPGDCLVIEDSLTGMRAARAAGMTCLAYAPEGDSAAFAQLGAAAFTSLHQLPQMFGALS
jgi:HAD superfamily hydrolase (TIGR01509 family)